MIGVVILNYNTAEDTIECVDSIVSTCKIPFKIYIVDNKSTDNSFELLNDLYSGSKIIKIIESDTNGGYSYGNNLGISSAISDGCDYILISNPDVVYYESTIDTLYNDIISNELIGVIGPSTPSLDQPESQLLRKVYTPLLYLLSKKPFLYLSKVFRGLKTEYDYPDDGNPKPFLFKGMVRGCCFLISSKLFIEIGLFDDNVFLYSEEWIIAKKIVDKGYFCAYEGRVKALHKEATSTGQNGTAFQSYHLYLSSFYYLQEYCKCNSIQRFFFCAQNLISYTVKAFHNMDYRRLYKKFVKTQMEMYHKRRIKIGY